jgi:hypothetical protein
VTVLDRAEAAFDAILDGLAGELDADERARAADGLRLWGEAMRRRWHRAHG